MIDKYTYFCRFPLGFVIFNIGYWCSYYDQLQYYITADGDSG